MSLMEENWSEKTVKNALRANASKSAHCVVYPNTARTLTAEHDGSWCPDKWPNVVCYVLQGNGIDRSDTAGCNGRGWRENKTYTLNTIDRPAIVFQQNQRDEVRNMGEQAGALTAQPGVHNQNFLCYPETARTLAARHDSSPCVDRGCNVIAIDCRNMVGNEQLSGTLQAKNEGGFSLNYVNPICYRSGGYGDMVEGVGTLRANGGDEGGGYGEHRR